MDNKEMVKRLSSLMQLDIDASHAYKQALDQIDHTGINQQLNTFRDDHERHINDLSAMIRSLGEEPPKRTKDFKGFLIEGMTALRGITGTEGTLKAMHTNERLTNRDYKDASEQPFRDDVRTLIQKNYDDERRHIRYIEDVLEKHLWEKR